MGTRKLGSNLTPEAFVLAAIKAGRTDKSKGIHVVYSGFNAAFRATFPNVDVQETTNRLAREGKIALRPCRGGAMIYLPADAPARTDGASKLLKAMGLK